ncbi:hypothetical protein G9U51_10660 [Calidifontibacter sp. DB0510]|uniref:Uncharacterized protein n=1 Tax=Metallococcus carri TaxID=1656884 RepID=A0A967EAG2_9MICO|nr:hypothetical protein [Metallococcus carri]NHN56235.1 hypothetical protein [Metallococcus carri]NOP38713.1 hypothetical protein [Calidifontibacter sp. DB2511S]
MTTRTKRSDADFLAEVERDEDKPLGPAIDGAPIRAITAAVDRRQRVETEIAEHVAAARAAGFSWAVIGEALGVTRQGALKRYGANR